jgi:hypothetical protein
MPSDAKPELDPLKKLVVPIEPGDVPAVVVWRKTKTEFLHTIKRITKSILTEYKAFSKYVHCELAHLSGLDGQLLLIQIYCYKANHITGTDPIFH